MKVLTTLLEVGGLAAITAGVALIYLPAAFIVGGTAAIAISYLLIQNRGGRVR